jgi:hypothetical protein
LPYGKKILLLEAYFGLGFYRLITLTCPFRRTAHLIGKKGMETPVSDEGVDINTIKQVSEAVRIMSRHTFWKSKCLVQAYTARRMLHKRKQKTTVYFGVSINDFGKMVAHAWLRCGSIIVTGENGHERFVVTGCFSDV